MNLAQSDLSGKIIGAAIRVHLFLGPGFIEAVYEEALCIELAEIGLNFSRQLVVPLTYRGKPIGEHRLDLLVEKRVVVELKTVLEFAPIHFSVVRSYLKASGSDLGLLLNFAAPTVRVKRVGREWLSKNEPSGS